MITGTTAAIAATVIGGAFVMGLLFAEGRGSQGGKWITKPAASLCFIAVGAIAVASGTEATPWMIWILVGLVLSAIGDAMLIPADKRAFLLGLGSFLLAHVAYAIAFLTPAVDAAWTLGALVAVALPSVLVARWLLPHVKSPMRPPVVAYIVAITAMMATAIAAVSAWGAPGLIPAGAALFMASDIAVARNRFVAPGLVNRAWGLPTYYAGQFLIAWSLFA